MVLVARLARGPILLREKDRKVFVQRRIRLARLKERDSFAQALCLFLVVGGAAAEPCCQPGPARGCNAVIQHGLAEGLARLTRRKPQFVRQRLSRRLQRAFGQIGTAAQGFLQHILKGCGAGLARQGAQGRAESVFLANGGFQHAGAGLRQQFGLPPGLDHLKPRGDIGLEREEMQQALAKGMNGLDFQPARGFNGAGKQAAGEHQLLGPGFCRAGRLNRRHQRPIRHQCPFGQRLEYPRRHIGGGSLGEREAQDARRWRARQQQPDNTLGQDMGFARAGIGGDPRRHGRVGGAVLDRLGLRQTHASSPGWPDHSLTRARWS